MEMWMCPVFLFLICCVPVLTKYPEYAVKVVNLNTVQVDSRSQTRIVGGQDTTVEQWPFIVQVLYLSRPRCTGVLLTSRHVLSAAHCFVYDSLGIRKRFILGFLISATNFSIRGGSTTLYSGGTIIPVADYIIHIPYSTRLRENDIAVVLTQDAATFSSAVATASIPQYGAIVPDNATVAYIGWGSTYILQEVWVNKVSNSVCKMRYRLLEAQTNRAFPVTDTMVCAGLLDMGVNDTICQGDSGGPLVYNGVVVGIVSWGWSCAESLFPGVNTRVANYTHWITDAVSQLSVDVE